MAELEAYSGDVAEQVMSGTLAETASLHSSSADQSPRRPYASHDDASSVTDDLFAPPPQELPQPRPEGESRTASGSHSHDTITVSDMPSVPAAAQAGESVRKTHASARTAPRPPPHGHSRRAPPAPRRSFAPARPRLALVCECCAIVGRAAVAQRAQWANGSLCIIGRRALEPCRSAVPSAGAAART